MALKKAVLGSAKLVISGVDSNGSGEARAAGEVVLSDLSLENERFWRAGTAVFILSGLTVRDTVDAVPLLFRGGAVIGRLAGESSRPEGSRLRGWRGEPRASGGSRWSARGTPSSDPGAKLILAALRPIRSLRQFFFGQSHFTRLSVRQFLILQKTIKVLIKPH